MASIQTNLSRSPYFDDFVENTEYYRILYKPGVAVQTRELNQTQAIMQDQVNKFGRSIYKEGSVVEGCAFTFDAKLAYVKINDTYTNSTAFTISDFKNQYVYNSNGLKAIIVDTIQGFQSQAPNTNTLYVKYINSATYSNSAQQSTFDPNETLVIATSANLSIGNVTVCSNTLDANIGNPTGFGYAMTSSEGVIFKKGTFLYVPKQTVLVTPYTNVPDGLSVGFDAIESIITAQANNSLYDNAAGSPNFSAPGADRLRIVPQLVVRNTVDVANNSSFFSVADFKAGNPVTVKQTAQYSALGAAIAQRTYETNGDFVVSPFIITTELKANTSDPLYANNVNLIASRGLGYVEGYRVEYLNKNIANLRKGTDFNAVEQQIVTANFGNFLYVNEFAGQFGDSSFVIQVELHNVAKTAVTSGTLLSTGFSATTKIGTAYIKGFTFDSGIPGTAASQYRLYLFNIVMNPGQNFADVKSVIYNDSGMEGVCDVVLSYNLSSNSYIAQLQQTTNSTLLYKFGQKALKPDGFDNNEFVYRRKSTAQFLANGAATVTLPPAAGSGSEEFPYLGTLSSSQIQEFYIVPTGTGYTANLTGNVAVTTANNADGTANVVGSGTLFLANYSVGDYIAVYTTTNPEEKPITYIANNTYMRVGSPFNNANSNTRQAKAFPVGAPIPFSNRTNRSITVSTTTADLQLGDQPASPFNVDVYYNVNRYNTVPIQKVINRKVFVKIDCANNAGGVKGPWSLGLPDVVSIDGVWVGSGSYSNSGQNLAKYFQLDDGQRDEYYDLAKMTVATNSPADNLKTSSTLLVELTHYTYNQSQGYGFFTANSYPIDDVNPANTNAIMIQQIPLYTSSRGDTYDLRDSVDFRPFATNTAVSATSIAGATVNPSSTLVLYGNPYLPAPDSRFQTDLEYYLQRIDRVSLDIGGNIVVTEGIPSATKPSVPTEKGGTMSLAIVNVPPYPSLTSKQASQYNRFDYAITSRITQNKRFTMKDIGALENRIENLEYYTSLSLLEQSASSLLVRSGVTGQNRFQNGIFVDPFRGFDLSNTYDPKFYIAIDPQRRELRPSFVQMRSTVTFDPVRSTGVQQHGELVMLNHTSNNVYQEQNYASKFRNCVEGNVYEWKGTIKLDPPGTLSPDITQSPDVINNIDLAQNWITLQNAWGTNWGNWVQVSSSKREIPKPPSNKGGRRGRGQKVYAGRGGSRDNTSNNGGSEITTVYERVGESLGTSISTNDYNLGNFVTGISILPYLKPAIITFAAHGLKPNTRLYAYFGDIPMSNHCAPANSTFGSTGVAGDTFSGVLGDPLRTDSKGNCYGYFYLPGNTFKAQENDFVLNDISDLSQGSSAIQTQARQTFYGSTLSVAMGESILHTREAVLTEVTQTQTNTVVTYVPAPTPKKPRRRSCGCGCFIYDTLVELEDNTTKPIGEIKIGDRVYNKDKTAVNTVKFIEAVDGTYFEKLYSPSRKIKPFATVNHPLFIDGKLSSVDPDKNLNWYPWFGKTAKLDVNSIVDIDDEIVYNLWVDGDNTYRVNGYGTHSIIGEGGLLKNIIEQDVVSYEKGLEAMKYYTETGKFTVYGVYIVNDLLGKWNNKFVNKVAGNILTNDTVVRKITNIGLATIGSIACLFKK